MPAISQLLNLKWGWIGWMRCSSEENEKFMKKYGSSVFKGWFSWFGVLCWMGTNRPRQMDRTTSYLRCDKRSDWNGLPSPFRNTLWNVRIDALRSRYHVYYRTIQWEWRFLGIQKSRQNGNQHTLVLLLKKQKGVGTGIERIGNRHERSAPELTRFLPKKALIKWTRFMT